MGFLIKSSGSIFDEDVDAIVNCVNCFGTMGKGLALEFKNRYPLNYENYLQECKEGQMKIGRPLPFFEDSKYIINFPTKFHWKDSSLIQYISDGLDSLINIIKILDIKSIAIPALGCGLGGLNQMIVIPTMIDKLSDISKTTQIVIFMPQGGK